MGDTMPASPASSAFPPTVSSIVRALDQHKSQALQSQLKIGELTTAKQSVEAQLEDLNAALSSSQSAHDSLSRSLKDSAASIQVSEMRSGDDLGKPDAGPH